MPLLSMMQGDGLGTLRLRLTLLRDTLPQAVADTIERIGPEVASMLSDAAPAGKSAAGGESMPMEGDAPGRLQESFTSTFTASASGATTTVSTTQPNKLALVRSGHRAVFPVRKRALMWPGLAHPVRRAGPVAPNDFVTPVLADAAVQAFAELGAAVGAALALAAEG
ncbi:MAG: hypothetical protein IVW57_00210 [Ktedonobacterales bacterium]|nr:hypothetical protein [Ktedonobacterales bacterium]